MAREPGDHAAGVGLHDWRRHVERDRRNRAGGVAADAGQATEPVARTSGNAAMNRTKKSITRSTCVCWSMISLTQTR